MILDTNIATDSLKKKNKNIIIKLQYVHTLHMIFCHFDIIKFVPILDYFKVKGNLEMLSDL